MTVRPTKTQISLDISPVWSESSLCTLRIAMDQRLLHADSEYSGQIGWVPMLSRVFAGCPVILLVLSWCSSNGLIQFARIENGLNRGTYISAHDWMLNLLYKLGKKIRWEDLHSIFVHPHPPPNLNKFTNNRSMNTRFFISYDTKIVSRLHRWLFWRPNNLHTYPLVNWGF